MNSGAAGASDRGGPGVGPGCREEVNDVDALDQVATLAFGVRDRREEIYVMPVDLARLHKSQHDL